MDISFTKMHGCGNDYIYINCLEGIPFDPNKLSSVMSPRHFSVGGDGIVLICASEVADFKMRMFNLDGSEGKMCGNAIRCVGKYVYENHLTDKLSLSIETLSGIKYLSLHKQGEKIKTVTVDMGKASLEAKDIPVLAKHRFINQPYEVDGVTYYGTAVSMGNPHVVIYQEEVKSLNLEKMGPNFENHPLFPERVNTEFIKVIDKTHLEMRVWERGSGETFACGTGACAATISSIINGYCPFDTPIEVSLIGGVLTITVDKDLNVKMEGPATKVYTGVFNYECETE
jgi:diaminopimelate epimerase